MKRIIIIICVLSFSLIGKAQLLIPKGIKALTYTISETKLSYLRNVTSDIQSQISDRPTSAQVSALGYQTKSQTDLLYLSKPDTVPATTIFYTKTQTDGLIANVSPSTIKIQFTANVTTDAPKTGDSILILSSLVGKYPEVWRAGVKQFLNTTATNAKNGYRYDSTNGFIVVKPTFAASEVVIINATPIAGWTNTTIPATQNLFKYSEQLDNAVWYKGYCTVTADQAADLTGRNTLDLVTVTQNYEEIGYNDGGAFNDLTAGATYRLSFDCKRGTMIDMRYSVYSFTNSAYIVPITSYYSQTSATEVKRISVTFTVPTNGHWTGIKLLNSSNGLPGASGTVYLGRVQLDKISSNYVTTTTAAKP